MSKLLIFVLLFGLTAVNHNWIQTHVLTDGRTTITIEEIVDGGDIRYMVTGCKGKVVCRP